MLKASLRAYGTPYIPETKNRWPLTLSLSDYLVIFDYPFTDA
jgi:hypothetical protein